MHAAKQEFSEQWSKRTLPEPGPDGMEHQFTVAVRVSLPTADLIVDRQRDLLLELILMIRSVSSNPVGALKSDAHVEILGNVVL